MHSANTLSKGVQRQTNLELLRLVSMFLVLVIHTNTVYDPWPIDRTAVLNNPGHCAFRFLIESLSCVCVNAFILLSGWFGIKFSVKKLLSFIFTVLFFSLVLALLPSARGQGVHLLIDIFTLNQYWFVKAYIILFILSPALNLFAEQSSKSLFQIVLIAFFIMQTVFSYISNSSWFEDGFSPIPFIGLYLLSRYIRIHQPAFSSFKKTIDLSIYIGSSFIITVLSIYLFKWLGTGGRLFNYTNPLVIVSSVFFFLFFTKIPIKNNAAVNWVAASSLGAYLLHLNPLVFDSYFVPTLASFSRISSNGLLLLLIFIYLIAVFLTGVFIDKIRLLVWRMILRLSRRDIG